MSLPHLILGLLHRQPDSGYDLNKRFERTVANFWTTDQSQIYRTLYKLRDKGWVKAETIVQDDNPNKKVYSITDAGYQALIEWLQTPLDDELEIRSAETGQIFFGDAIGGDKLIEVQQYYIEQIQQKINAYHAIVAEFFGEVDFNTQSLGVLLSHATLEYGIRILTAEVEWRDDLITRVKQHQKHNDKGENNT